MSEKGLRYIIRTQSIDGLISQEILLQDEVQETSIGIHILDTRKKQIRDALVELGWTPPPNKPMDYIQNPQNETD